MSKSTKIIAALGVVAGLGVAALPAFTYATETVSGTVDVYVEIPEAIAMTIVGNNDGGSAPYPTPATTGVDVFASGSATTGTVDGHTTTTTSTSSSSYVELSQNQADTTTALSTITVYTNAAHGYTLSVQASGDGSLVNQSNSAYTIAPLTTAGTAPAAGDGEWGFKLTASAATSPDAAGNVVTGYSNWSAVPHSSATVIAYEDVATSGGTEYVANYGVGTKADQAAGIYKNTLTYTATTKNSAYTPEP